MSFIEILTVKAISVKDDRKNLVSFKAFLWLKTPMGQKGTGLFLLRILKQFFRVALLNDFAFFH
ncbi:MAG: hypothetical protein PHT43_07515, partial [Anaerolineaceae bacterium]|nr:hypothetical protein [Anaerolineaceae bacterium]